MKPKNMLIASSGTIDGITEMIKKFYCGTTYNLVTDGDNQWKLVGAMSGKTLERAFVIKKRGRFRFEYGEKS